MSTDLIDDLLADARDRMHKSVESTRDLFGSVRTGRASPALLDRIMVDYYGTATPFSRMTRVRSRPSSARSSSPTSGSPPITTAT
jgi:ribosome recycling factor